MVLGPVAGLRPAPARARSQDARRSSKPWDWEKAPRQAISEPATATLKSPWHEPRVKVGSSTPRTSNARAIERLHERRDDRHLRNVEVIAGKPDDPELPAAPRDAVLMVITYHEIADYRTVLAHVRASLKPGMHGW